MFKGLRGILLLPVLAMGAAALAIVALSWIYGRAIEHADQELILAMDQALNAEEVRALSRAVQRDTLNVLFEPEDADKKALMPRIDERATQMAARAKSLFDGATPEGKAALPDFVARQQGVLDALAEARQMGFAHQQGPGYDFFRKDVRQKERAASKLTDDFIEAQAKHVAAMRAMREELRMRSVLVQLIAAAFLILVSTGLCLAVTRARVTRPLSTMTGAMGALADGHVEAEIPDFGRDDEIGAMSRALRIFKRNEIKRRDAERAEANARKAREDMAAELAAAERDESEKRERRAKALETLVAGFSENSRKGLDAMSGASAELHKVAQSLNEIVAGTRRHLESVIAASESTSANVQTVASASEEMSSSILEITRQVNETTRVTSNAVHQAEEVNGRVGTLNEAARKIDEIVKLIADIAAKTDLLALNATIEAARAGEAGKGFAVVASEVKALANQTGRATADISTNVRSIQDATDVTVQGIKMIGDTIRHIDEIVSAIAAAIEQQSAATREISRNTQGVAEGATEMARSIEEVGANMSRADETSGQVGEAARAVDGASGGLGQEIRRFIDGVRAV